MRFFNKPKHRAMYAVKAGDKAGGFLVYIRERDIGGAYAFLFVPDPMESMYITEVEARNAIRYELIEFVEVLPKGVYEICSANFDYYGEKMGVLCKQTT